MTDLVQVGYNALRAILQTWQTDEDEIEFEGQRGERTFGFRWWAGNHEVRVTAELPQPETEVPWVKIQVISPVLINVDLTKPGRLELLSSLTPLATSTYALQVATSAVPHPDNFRQKSTTLWFSSTAYVTEETCGWLAPFFAKLALIPVINAEISGTNLPQMIGSGDPAHSRPTSLRGRPHDEILDVVKDVIAPLGQGESRWSDCPEFEDFAEEWGRSDYCFATGDKSGLSAETPFGSSSALIRLWSDQDHPQLGAGLLTTLQLPMTISFDEAATMSSAFNLSEQEAWTGFPLVGAWHAVGEGDDAGIAFSSFVPNAFYMPGLAGQIAIWMIERARWVRENFYPDLIDDTMAQILERRFGRL